MRGLERCTKCRAGWLRHRLRLCRSGWGWPGLGQAGAGGRTPGAPPFAKAGAAGSFVENKKFLQKNPLRDINFFHSFGQGVVLLRHGKASQSQRESSGMAGEAKPL